MLKRAARKKKGLDKAAFFNFLRYYDSDHRFCRWQNGGSQNLARDPRDEELLHAASLRSQLWNDRYERCDHETVCQSGCGNQNRIFVFHRDDHLLLLSFLDISYGNRRRTPMIYMLTSKGVPFGKALSVALMRGFLVLLLIVMGAPAVIFSR